MEELLEELEKLRTEKAKIRASINRSEAWAIYQAHRYDEKHSCSIATKAVMRLYGNRTPFTVFSLGRNVGLLDVPPGLVDGDFESLTENFLEGRILLTVDEIDSYGRLLQSQDIIEGKIKDCAEFIETVNHCQESAQNLLSFLHNNKNEWRRHNIGELAKMSSSELQHRMNDILDVVGYCDYPRPELERFEDKGHEHWQGVWQRNLDLMIRAAKEWINKIVPANEEATDSKTEESAADTGLDTPENPDDHPRFYMADLTRASGYNRRTVRSHLVAAIVNVPSKPDNTWKYSRSDVNKMIEVIADTNSAKAKTAALRLKSLLEGDDK